MSWLTDVHWHDLLVPSVALPELVLRGSAVYLALFALLRLVLKRQAAGLAVTDLLVVVLIADAAQNGMAADYRSVPDAVILVSVIVGWAYALDWLGFHVPAIRRLLIPPKLPLVENGTLRVDNMRRELVTREELFAQLREQGVGELQRVRAAFMEGDGRISVLTVDEGRTTGPPDRRLL